ncbi:MAG: hypothetical protein IJ702_05695 [Fretibacterium sp.]|nr:hypothetical protein [Fretibacterium sp.]
MDNEKVILAGAMPTLAEAMPGALITGFSKVSEAISFARSNQISIAFLDIELGRQSGIDLCKALVDIHPLTNVIYHQLPELLPQSLGDPCQQFSCQTAEAGGHPGRAAG